METMRTGHANSTRLVRLSEHAVETQERGLKCGHDTGWHMNPKPTQWNTPCAKENKGGQPWIPIYYAFVKSFCAYLRMAEREEERIGVPAPHSQKGLPLGIPNELRQSKRKVECVATTVS